MIGLWLQRPPADHPLAGVTAFSDWVVGNYAGPTYMGLSRFAALGQVGLLLAGLFGALIILGLLAALLAGRGGAGWQRDR